MKKIFAFIMAVLVVSFNVIPCADDAALTKDGGSNYSPTKLTSPDEPHDDTCSPFCICAGVAVTGCINFTFRFYRSV